MTTTRKKLITHPVLVGQVWQERDSRFTRYVRVIDVGATHVVISRCTASGKETAPRLTVARRERFRGQCHGYTLFSQPK